MKKTTAILSLCLCISLYGCHSSETTALSQDYLIIKDETKANNAKRVVEIELPSTISQEQLEEIADSIKNSTGNDVKNVFIAFRVKDSSSSGYWAMVEYTPEKSVKIMGNTQTEEKSLQEQINDYAPKGNLLGVWEFKWGMDCAIGLHESENKVFSNYICDSGVSADQALKYNKVNGEQRIEDIEPNEYGEYMLINQKSDLEFRNSTKTYYIGKKIR